MFITVARLVTDTELDQLYTTDMVTLNAQIILFIEGSSVLRVRPEGDAEASMQKISTIHLLGNSKMLVLGTPASITARFRS